VHAVAGDIRTKSFNRMKPNMKFFISPKVDIENFCESAAERNGSGVSYKKSEKFHFKNLLIV